MLTSEEVGDLMSVNVLHPTYLSKVFLKSFQMRKERSCVINRQCEQSNGVASSAWVQSLLKLEGIHQQLCSVDAVVRQQLPDLCLDCQQHSCQVVDCQQSVFVVGDVLVRLVAAHLEEQVFIFLNQLPVVRPYRRHQHSSSHIVQQRRGDCPRSAHR